MKTKTLILIFLSLAMSVSLWGYSFVDNGIYYNILSGDTSVEVTYRNTNYNSYSGRVDIPSSVSYSGKTYSVTFIGSSAFMGCTGLTSVTLPNSVTSIGNQAFYGCTGLTSVTLPNSVTSIGSSAFLGCPGITVPLYNNTIFAYMPTSYSGSYTIPSGITAIAGNAFYYCTGLTSVTIPNSVTSIGNWAFGGCTGLTSVTLPNSVTSIDYGAFANCTGLTSVYFSRSTPPTIGNMCFNNANTTYYVPCGTKSAYQTALGASSSKVIEHFPYSVTIRSYDPSLGTVAITQQPSCQQQTANIQAFAASHYHFVRWSDGNTDNPRCVTVASDTSLTAIFEGDLQTITATGTNGMVDGGGTYNYGSYITLNAIPDEHFHFAKWSDGNTDNPRTITVSGDDTFTAIFEIDRHTVSSNNDFVSGTGEYDYGTTVTLTAHSNEFVTFIRWDDGVLDSTRIFVLDRDTIMNAVYDTARFVITATCQHGTVTGSGTYVYPDVVTLIATPDEGYRFVKWSDDNDFNPRVFVVREDLTVEAICEEAPVIDDVENVEADTPAFYIVGSIIYNPDSEPLRVYSAEGKLIKTSDSDINMECYPKGIYMVVDNRGNAIKVPVQ